MKALLGSNNFRNASNRDFDIPSRMAKICIVGESGLQNKLCESKHGISHCEPPRFEPTEMPKRGHSKCGQMQKKRKRVQRRSLEPGCCWELPRFAPTEIWRSCNNFAQRDICIKSSHAFGCQRLFRRPQMSGRRMSGTSRRFPKHFLNCDFS